MYSHNEIAGVYGFINSTAEGNLRKMLVGGAMTDVYFRVFLKIGKFCTEADFVEAFMSESVPTMKMNPKERAIRETLWPVCKKRLEEIGLLNISVKAA